LSRLDDERIHCRSERSRTQSDTPVDVWVKVLPHERRQFLAPSSTACPCASVWRTRNPLFRPLARDWQGLPPQGTKEPHLPVFEGVPDAAPEYRGHNGLRTPTMTR
jgi:hypothetical protein